jgi:hypothetical protein
MKHSREDYDRIQDPAGLIPEDEPVFLLRAQDECAAATVEIWAAYARGSGADPAIVELARNHAAKMRAWPKRKTPDLPAALQHEAPK